MLCVLSSLVITEARISLESLERLSRGVGSGMFMDCSSISSSSSDFTVLQSVSPESISSKLRLFEGHGSLHGFLLMDRDVGYRLIRFAYFEQCAYFQSINLRNLRQQGPFLLNQY